MDNEFSDFSPADTAILTRALEEAERQAAAQLRVSPKRTLASDKGRGGGAGEVALAPPTGGAGAGAGGGTGGEGRIVSAGGKVAPTATGSGLSTIQQPAPQKISRSTSSIIVSTRQVGKVTLLEATSYSCIINLNLYLSSLYIFHHGQYPCHSISRLIPACIVLTYIWGEAWLNIYSRKEIQF